MRSDGCLAALRAGLRVVGGAPSDEDASALSLQGARPEFMPPFTVRVACTGPGLWMTACLTSSGSCSKGMRGMDTHSRFLGCSGTARWIRPALPRLVGLFAQGRSGRDPYGRSGYADHEAAGGGNKRAR